MKYDYIIIGAGMAGLYFAYRLEKMAITNYLILEKNNYIGGRVFATDFHDTKINLGASIIGIYNKHLIKLCKDLNIGLNDSYGDYNLIFKDGDKHWFNKKVKEMYEIFKKKNDENYVDETFITFLKKNLNEDEVERYLEHIEFFDYLTASTKCTFENYPVDDMYLGRYLYHTIKGGWSVLVKKLLEYVKEKKIILENLVTEIEFNNNSYKITTDKAIYFSKKIVFATDINIKNIKIKGFSIPEFINLIGSMDYVRLYTRHENHNLTKSVMGNNFLRKMIPIGKNIIMSSYTENIFAKKLAEAINSSTDKIKTINEFISIFLNGSFDVSPIKKDSDYIFKYWEHGSHYYKPGYEYNKSYFINGEKNLMICGEIISKSQGYVEGAISSVDDLMDNLFIDKKYKFKSV